MSSISGLKEECGVFGIYDLDNNQNAGRTVYYGLSALQHRGQEACGIAVSNTEGPKGNIEYYKGLGLVNEVFSKETLDKLEGNIGVGHVRYSTSGGGGIENTQPIVLKYVKGTLAFAHNGNLVNAKGLRNKLEWGGAIFHSDVDSEVFAYHIARERLHTDCIEDAVKKASVNVRGAYALVVMSPRKLIGVRDPYGLKPLCLGKRDNAYILASESCAIIAVGGEVIRDIEPGEIVTITPDGIFSDKSLVSDKKARCVFEYIYFARADSKIDDVSVYDARIRAGKALARSYPVEADLVVGVPESGIIAAKGYAEEANIPFGLAFYKNSYIGRTFIKPDQSEREIGVKMKLSVLESAVKGKRIIMVDDSIVRGTTSANIIKMLKAAGATEVHVRISSPPFLHPCYFGTDVPSNEQLIAHNHTSDEICKIIGADSLGYLKIEDLSSMANGLEICSACFSGQYPMDINDDPIKEENN